MQEYMSYNKNKQVICDKCKETHSNMFLFPHKKGLCMLCTDCKDDEIMEDNMLAIESPLDHPYKHIHYKFDTE